MFVRSTLAALAICVAPLALAPAASAEAPVYTSAFSNTAVQGYDPVAYFKVGAPVKGSSEFTTEYNGAEWNFASQENLDAFVADPEAYAPQYGGYCAWAVAQGQTAKGDAQQWHIEDGKLYLNINGSIKKKWLADRATLIPQADENWPGVIE